MLMADTSTNLSKIQREHLLDICSRIKNKDAVEVTEIAELEQFIKSMKYGLTFERHEEPVDAMLRTHIPVFKEFKKIINNPDSSNCNFLIEGDNLHSLKLLEKTHKGAIDVIYIDPPYNTLNDDFAYGDVMIDENDGFVHSKWLSFMKERLIIARKLLSETGAIFMSIDDNENATLKLLCDEIFGEDNFIANAFVLDNLKGKTNASFITSVGSRLLVYLKNRHAWGDDGFNSVENVFADKVEKKYTLEDEYGFYTDVTFKKTGQSKLRIDRPYMFYPILEKDELLYAITEEEFNQIYDAETNTFNDDFLLQLKNKYSDYSFILPTDTNGEYLRWTSGYPTFCKKINKEIYYHNGVKQKSRPTAAEMLQVYASGTPKSIMYKPEYSSGTNDYLKTVNNDIFDFPKPIQLIKDILNLIPKERYIVLDFFAGSGTTAQAVLERNFESNAKCSFILCTNNEISAARTIEYLQKFGHMKDVKPVGKNKILQAKVDKFFMANPDVYQKLIVENKSEYEAYGICQSVTFPRIQTVITGIRPDGSKYSDEIKSNLKYLQTDMIDKTDDDLDELLYEASFYLAELENMAMIDNVSICIANCDEDIDDIIANATEKLKEIFIADDVLLSSQQKDFFMRHNVAIKQIPNYYYKEM